MVTIPSRRDIGTVTPARDPGVRATSASFGAIEGRAAEIQGRQVAAFAERATSFVDGLRQRRQRAEDNAAIAEIQTRMLVDEMSFRSSIRESAPANGAGMIDAYRSGWTPDRVNTLIDEVSSAGGYRLSDDARQTLLNRGMSLQAQGILALGQLEHQARAGVFANGLEAQANTLATAVFNSPGDIEAVRAQTELIIEGAEAYLDPLALQELQRTLPHQINEAWYRGRLNEGDAAGVLRDLRNPENGDYGVPYATALNLIEEARGIVEIEDTRRIGLSIGNQVFDGVRSGSHPAISGAVGSGGALPETLPRASDAMSAAVIGQESDGRPDVIGDDGTSFGIGQIQVGTARGIANFLGDDRLAAASDEEIQQFLLDGDNGREYSRAHLDQLLQAFNGDTMLAIMAYNMGEEGVRIRLRRHGDPRTGEISRDAFLAAVDADFNHREPHESDARGRGNPARYYQQVIARIREAQPDRPAALGQEASGRVISYGDSLAVGMGGVDGVEGRAVGSAGFANGQLPELGEIQDGDTVLISVGSNDANVMGIEDYARNLTDLVTQVQDAGGVAVITGLNADYGENFRRFDRAARAVADQTGATYVPGRPPDEPDRLHFSPSGYEQRVTDALAAVDASRPSPSLTAGEVEAGPAPGSYEAGLRSIRAMGLSAEQEEVALEAYNRRWQEQNQIDEERLRADRAAGWEHIDNGGSFSTLPADLVARLRRTDRGTLQALAEAAAGATRVTDPALYNELLEMRFRRPEEFIAIDLMEHAGALARADFDRLRTAQGALIQAQREAEAAALEDRIDLQRNRMASVDLTPNEIWSSAEFLLRSRGIVSGDDDDDDVRESDEWQHFLNFMFDRAQAHREATGNDPTPAQLRDFAMIGLAQVETFRFTEEAPGGEAFEGTTFEGWTDYDDIPVDIRNQVEIALFEATSGDPELRFRPSEGAVEDEFNRLVQEAVRDGLSLEDFLAGRTPEQVEEEERAAVAAGERFVEPQDAEADRLRDRIRTRLGQERERVSETSVRHIYRFVLNEARRLNIPVDAVLARQDLLDLGFDQRQDLAR